MGSHYTQGKVNVFTTASSPTTGHCTRTLGLPGPKHTRGLCSCCSLCLQCLSSTSPPGPQPRRLTPSFIPVHTQIVPTHRVLPSRQSGSMPMYCLFSYCVVLFFKHFLLLNIISIWYFIDASVSPAPPNNAWWPINVYWINEQRGTLFKSMLKNYFK